jgi:polyisoprenoid-binding protein YceI
MSTWNLDKVHSEIGFKVKHLMISTVRGQFTSFEGSMDLPDNTNLEKAQISFTADASSINTGNEMRDNHLRSADFFNSNEFPAVSFNSKDINKKDGNTYKVIGDFTMHGITKEITLDVVFNGVTTGMDGIKVASFEIAGLLSRKDYGLLWNAPIEQGGVAVSDEVKLDINAEFKEVK